MNEEVVEQAALDWLGELSYQTLHGDTICPESPTPERVSYGDVLLIGRLRAALQRLNPGCPDGALNDALRKLLTTHSPALAENNRQFHTMLLNGVNVEAPEDGRIKGYEVKVVDFDAPHNNDWLAVNQFTVIEHGYKRRPDVVVFVNGLPLAVLELKNAANENATIWGAFNQLQTYKQFIPSLFTANALLVISDGTEARLGSLTADRERFMPWRTIDGVEVAPLSYPQLEVLLKGVFEPSCFLSLLRSYTVFEVDRASITKKLAGYHQFHAVEKAVERTIQAQGGKVGVIWHTQGSGKSLTMAFYAGRLIQHRALYNPTIIVITDRNDLDDQLFSTFALCTDLLRGAPVQADSRDHLRDLISHKAAGGVIFTTLQKFLPEKGKHYPQLSPRDNIIVIADEAHRSQYDLVDGYARHVRDALPNARFIAFTGTPIEKADHSTTRVFGDLIDVYDIGRAVEDGATVPIYYEARWAKLNLDDARRPRIDPDFEDVTEGEEVDTKEALKNRWSRMEAIVGTPQRLRLLAQDIVTHFEQRLQAMDGKGMIVCMSRRICVELYQAIVTLRPDWHDTHDARGAIKVVMTGSATDPLHWQDHIRNKQRREDLSKRLKDHSDPLKLVLVRDMWLTGFDAPPLHTLYVDKPMRGHGLMQAIARVNRVFRDKPGGLIVDYLGLSEQLRDALGDYTEGDRHQVGIPTETAIALMLEKVQAVKALFQGFDYTAYFKGKPIERLRVIPNAMQHILALEDGKHHFMQAVNELSKAYALVVTTDEARKLVDEVAFFQGLRAAFAKSTAADDAPPKDYDHAVRQIVAGVVLSDEVVDIFAATGIQKPNIGILDDAFLRQVQQLPQQNLALEMLQKLLNDEIRTQSRQNVARSRSFAQRLEETIRAYQNRSIETVEVIKLLIDLARQMRQARERYAELGLSEEEVAFYDALSTHQEAVDVLSDERLRDLTQEIVSVVRSNTSTDWTKRESTRARLRTAVKRVLRQYGFAKETTERIVVLIMEQAELMNRAA